MFTDLSTLRSEIGKSSPNAAFLLGQDGTFAEVQLWTDVDALEFAIDKLLANPAQK